MLINFSRLSMQQGISLIETMVFIVVVSMALTALVYVFNESVAKTVDPAIRIKSLERAQALMDEILVRKFDENTPTGGVPACDSTDGPSCAGIIADSDYDDVGDYNGYVDNTDPFIGIEVDVVEAGAELGLSLSQARRITVTATAADGKFLTLSSYKVNF